MTSIIKTNKKQTKLRLGKKTDLGYDFSAKIDFKEDFSLQIAKLMKEKKLIDELELELNKLKKEVERLIDRKKDKDLSYYYSVGKNLLFLNKENFREFSPYKIYQRIYEEIPQIVPHIKNKKVIQKHLEIMYKLAHVKENLLTKASWDQWYEMMKFKTLYKKQRVLEKIIKLIKGKKLSGPKLRLLINKEVLGN